MRYTDKFLKMVEAFSGSNTADGLYVETDLGLQQFHEYESTGKKPENPDPYFTFILDGKKWFEWTVNNYAENYRKPMMWDGWWAIAHDMKDDEILWFAVRRRLRSDDGKGPQEFIDYCNSQRAL